MQPIPAAELLKRWQSAHWWPSMPEQDRARVQQRFEDGAVDPGQPPLNAFSAVAGGMEHRGAFLLLAQENYEALLAGLNRIPKSDNRVNVINDLANPARKAEQREYLYAFLADPQRSELLNSPDFYYNPCGWAALAVDARSDMLFAHLEKCLTGPRERSGVARALDAPDLSANQRALILDVLADEDTSVKLNATLPTGLLGREAVVVAAMIAADSGCDAIVSNLATLPKALRAAVRKTLGDSETPSEDLAAMLHLLAHAPAAIPLVLDPKSTPQVRAGALGLASDPESMQLLTMAWSSSRSPTDRDSIAAALALSDDDERREALRHAARLQMFLTYSSFDQRMAQQAHMEQRLKDRELPAAEARRLRAQLKIFAKREYYHGELGIGPAFYVDGPVTLDAAEVVSQPPVPKTLTVDEGSARRWHAGRAGNSFTGVVDLATNTIYLMPVSPAPSYVSEGYPVGAMNSEDDMPIRTDYDRKFDTVLHGPGKLYRPEPAHMQYAHRLARKHGVNPEQCLGFTVSQGHDHGVWEFRWRSRSLSEKHFKTTIDDPKNFRIGLLSPDWAESIGSTLIAAFTESPERKATLKARALVDKGKLTPEEAKVRLNEVYAGKAIEVARRHQALGTQEAAISAANKQQPPREPWTTETPLTQQEAHELRQRFEAQKKQHGGNTLAP